MRRMVARLAAGLSLLIGGHAYAQDCESRPYVPVAGSAGEAVTRQALSGFAKLYGATGAAESEVLPMLRASGESPASEQDGVLLFHIRWTSMFGAARQLLVAEQPSGDCPSMLRSDYDLHAGTFGLGLRHGPVSVFYLTSTIVGAPSGIGSRVLMPPFAWVPPGYYWFAAPFIGPWEYEKSGYSISGDYIAGVQLEALGTSLAAGYIGTQGLYTNLSQQKIRAFATAAIAREFSELAYLKAGLDRVSTLEDGLSSLYARKVVFSPPPTPTNDGFSLPDVSGVSMWTGHLEHANIMKLLSVRSALAVAPEVFLHDLALSIHTTDYHIDPSDKGRRIRVDPTALSFTAGTVRVPENRALGQPGDQLISVKAEARMFRDSKMIGDLALGLGFNDPEVLTRFPSAQNVFNMTFGGTFAPR